MATKKKESQKLKSQPDFSNEAGGAHPKKPWRIWASRSGANFKGTLPETKNIAHGSVPLPSDRGGDEGRHPEVSRKLKGTIQDGGSSSLRRIDVFSEEANCSLIGRSNLGPEKKKQSFFLFTRGSIRESICVILLFSARWQPQVYQCFSSYYATPNPPPLAQNSICRDAGSVSFVQAEEGPVAADQKGRVSGQLRRSASRGSTASGDWVFP